MEHRTDPVVGDSIVRTMSRHNSVAGPDGEQVDLKETVSIETSVVDEHGRPVPEQFREEALRMLQASSNAAGMSLQQSQAPVHDPGHDAAGLHQEVALSSNERSIMQPWQPAASAHHHDEAQQGHAGAFSSQEISGVQHDDDQGRDVNLHHHRDHLEAAPPSHPHHQSGTTANQAGAQPAQNPHAAPHQLTRSTPP